MDDIKLALLGSKAAAKRLTDAGVLFFPEYCNGCRWRGRHQKCSCCRRNANLKDCYEATQNTRAPILSESELKKLEENT